MARRKSYLGFAAPGPGDLNPAWGAATAGAIGSGTSIAVRAMSGADKHAELIGLGAGVAAGTALMLSPRSRAAGFAAIVTALMTNGLRFAEAQLSAKQKIKDLSGAKATFTAKAGTDLKTQLAALQTEAAAAGFGAATAQRRQAFGAATAQRRQAFGIATATPMQALGVATAQKTAALGVVSPEVIRSLGRAGHNATPTFQGPNAMPVNIVGSQNGIGRHFGATIFG